MTGSFRTTANNPASVPGETALLHGEHCAYIEDRNANPVIPHSRYQVCTRVVIGPALA